MQAIRFAVLVENIVFTLRSEVHAGAVRLQLHIEAVQRHVVGQTCEQRALPLVSIDLPCAALYERALYFARCRLSGDQTLGPFDVDDVSGDCRACRV